MTDAALLDDLVGRGLVQDCTDRAGLRARLAEGPVTVYFGCDPTADSLHIGNLLGLLVLRRFQDAGHRPIALAGGATGMVGDPGGRSEERNLLDEETLAANVTAIKTQIGRVVDLSGTGPAGGLLVDNRDWTADVRLLDFLREIGKHVTVNTMLARDSVKNRLASEHGISFTEFSYMLLQAHDFLRLEADLDCQVQVGGSDQWGNMLGGVDLIRRLRQRQAWVIAWPLITGPDGTKLGKSTGGRVWLDPGRTTPYAFYQHWMGADDRQVEQFLAQFTMLPLGEVGELAVAHGAEPERRLGQRTLAREVTTLVHGPTEARAAEAASAILFGESPDEATLDALRTVGREVPVLPLTRTELDAGLELVEAMARVPDLAASKGEARRAVAQGGVYINGVRAAQGQRLGTADLLHDRFVLVRRGKKAHALADLAPESVRDRPGDERQGSI